MTLKLGSDKTITKYWHKALNNFLFKHDEKFISLQKVTFYMLVHRTEEIENPNTEKCFLKHRCLVYPFLGKL